MVTKNFSLSEIEHSDTAERHNISNNVPRSSMNVLMDLFENVMQPLRDHVGPLYISSGYRSPELNPIVGGSTLSQHMYTPERGSACDFIHKELSTPELVNKILELGLPFDQLILEYPSSRNGGWVHVSHCGNAWKNRYEIRVKEKGTKYVPLDFNNKWDINLRQLKRDK